MLGYGCVIDLFLVICSMKGKICIQKKTRGFLPITIDLETSGPDPAKHGILEIAAVVPLFTDEGMKSIVFHRHTILEVGMLVDPEASLVHRIPIDSALRLAITVEQMLSELNLFILKQCTIFGARRGMLVAHNPSFDMAFIQKACSRYDITLHMHQYTLLDTASMGMMRHHESVLAKLCQREGLGFSPQDAHSAIYDAFMTARLFWSFMGESMAKNIKDLVIV